MRALHIAFALVGLAGCAEFPALGAKPQSDWDTSLSYARQDASSGNYHAADRVLAEFERTHPNTPEAREIEFWRAVYLIDPANAQGSLVGGISALDGYLAADSAGRYVNEATVLRRTAAAAQYVATLNSPPDTVATPAPAGAKDTVVIVKRTREEEIASLREQLARSKDELAKVSAELDRIKKRLANPSR